MRVFGQMALFSWCLGIAACGPSEPRSPLILGDKPPQALPGPRDLTSGQSRSLQGVITSAGEECGSITLAYLGGIDVVNGSESWEVRCPDSTYAVLIRSDGTPSTVRRCVRGERGGSRDDHLDRPCSAAYAGRPFRGQPQEGPLNPDLGKLLQPMIAKDGKVD